MRPTMDARVRPIGRRQIRLKGLDHLRLFSAGSNDSSRHFDYEFLMGSTGRRRPVFVFTFSPTRLENGSAMKVDNVDGKRSF